MTHEITLPRMSTPSMHEGTIGVEDRDDGIAEIGFVSELIEDTVEHDDDNS